jgi:hypothetical protein
MRSSSACSSGDTHPRPLHQAASMGYAASQSKQSPTSPYFTCSAPSSASSRNALRIRDHE